MDLIPPFNRKDFDSIRDWRERHVGVGLFDLFAGSFPFAKLPSLKQGSGCIHFFNEGHEFDIFSVEQGLSNSMNDEDNMCNGSQCHFLFFSLN